MCRSCQTALRSRADSSFSCGPALDPFSATLPTSYVNAFVEGLALSHADLNLLVRRASIDARLLALPGARVTQEQFATLFQLLVAHLEDEMPGLYGRPLRRGTLKILLILMLDAPDLATAMRRWQQFDRVLHDDFSFEVRREGALASIAIRLYPTQARSARLVQELHLKLVHGIASWIVGKRLGIERVDFAFPRPPDAAEYVYIFPGPVYFDQPATAMYIDAAYLQQPVRSRTRSELRDFLQGAPQNWFFVPFDKTLLSHRLRSHLESRLHESSNIQSAALALNCSERTLARHLSAEGTTFQQVKDVLRRDIAVQKLLKSRESIAAIARATGFATVSAFHRAFRSWTGSTPLAYRRQAGRAHRVAAPQGVALTQ
ncbi:AraC family transcriptional regulator [Variovorax sp. IB41]|nr:AraC family transcriptional regulator [Variovorax sp. IB41]